MIFSGHAVEIQEIGIVSPVTEKALSPSLRPRVLAEVQVMCESA